jgi:hypothetical protein
LLSSPTQEKPPREATKVTEMNSERFRQTLSWRERFGFLRLQIGLGILAIAIVSLGVIASGCGSMSRQPNGQISIFVVSWPLTKKLVVPEAGLPNHKVTLVDPSNSSVVATELTKQDGTVLFELPPGTYEILGAGDPTTVYLGPGEHVNLKLVIH